ncbi:MAG: DUF6318 family protein [Actinomycetes bacterium]
MTREGAAAFAKHYFEVSNDATESGKLGDLRALADSTCQTCRRYQGYLHDAYAGGGHIDGGTLVVTSSVAPPIQGDQVTVTVIGDQKPGELVDPSGKVKSRIQAISHGDLEVRLQWTRDRWLVAEIVMFNSRG